MKTRHGGNGKPVTASGLSERNWKDLIEALPQPVFEADPEGRLTYANQAAFAVFGYSREDFEGGINILQTVVPEDRERAGLAVREAISGDPLTGTEFTGLRKDGSRFPMIIHSRAVREGETVKGLRGIVVDISSRKKVEEAFFRIEEETRRLAGENEILAEVSRVITSSFDISEVYERFANEVRKLIEFDWIGVNLVDFGKKTVHIAYVAGESLQGRLAGDSFPLEGSAIKTVVADRCSLLGQGEAWERLLARFPQLTLVKEGGFSSMMLVPLVSRDRGFGVLSFLRREPDAYGTRDLRVAEGIANQVAGAISNARLFGELKQTEEALRKSEETAHRLAAENAAMAKIGRTISSTLHIEEVYERFSEEVQKLIPFERITVNLINPDGATYRMVYVAGQTVSGRKPGEVFPLAGTVTESLILTRSGQILNIEDEKEVLRRFPGLGITLQDGFRSLMGVPLVYKDQVIGSLHLRNLKLNAYGQDDLRVAGNIASQISGAIANAQLFGELKVAGLSLARREEEARRLAKENEVLAEVGRIITSAIDIQEVYERFAAEVKRLIAFEWLAVNLVDVAEKTVTVAYCSGMFIPGRMAGDVFALAGSATEAVVAGRSSVLSRTGNRGEMEARFPSLTPVYGAGIPSVMMVPLISKDEVIGALCFAHAALDAYGAEDIRLAEDVAHQIAGAIANSHLFAQRARAEEALKRSEEKARKLAEENAIVAEIGRIVSSTLDIDEIYSRFAEEVRKLVSFDRTNISLIDRGQKEARAVYTTGLPVAGRRREERFPLAGSMTAEAIRTRTALLCHPKSREEVVNRFPVLTTDYDAGLRSVMVVPLFSRERAIGSLFFGLSREDAYTEEDRRIAGTIASQIAGAIENAQLYAEHKRVEESLRESEEKYRQLFEEAPVGYHDLDLEGRLTRVNRTELDMLGYSAEEVLGRPVWEFILEKEFGREATLAKLVSGRIQDHPFERAYVRKNGKPIWVLIKEHPLRDPQGKLVGIRSTLQDITERKRADEERLVLQEQLRHSQKMEAVGQLAGGVAHDFNNLLTVIQGNCELSLFDLHEGDPLKGNIEEIKKASERATGLTRQLLAFSRRQVLEFKVLDLNGVLKDLEKMLRRVIGEDVELETGLAESLWRVKTDPGQIEQVIINLAVNARDAMPVGGKLIIETANVELDEEFGRSHIGVEPGCYVQLSVSDTGAGMTAEVRERIFDPFFTTKEKGKGTGLGLSTVYGIVKQSGGSIWVYSETGLGSTFKIYLPRADEGVADAEARGEEREIPRGRETVLLVEDEDAVRRIAAEFLRKQGYTVLEAHQGGDALLICRRTESVIHLMVTDVVMPGMSGRELVENLVPLKPEMKILYMSGYTDNAIVHHGVLEPGVHFLQKPFTLNDFARKVRDVLDGS